MCIFRLFDQSINVRKSSLNILNFLVCCRNFYCSEKFIGTCSFHKGAKLIGAPIGLAQVAEHALVIPSRPHAMRMLLEGALAREGRKARVALEIESVPAMLDLVRHDGFHAVLSLNAIESSAHADALQVRPIHKPRLTASLWIATSARRPRGPLIDEATRLLKDLIVRQWA